MVIVNLKPSLSYMFFMISHLIVGISQINLYEALGLIWPIKKLINERPQILNLDSQIGKILLINTQPKIVIRLCYKKGKRTYRRFR